MTDLPELWTPQRDVQDSLFPEIQKAKPVGGLPGSVFVGTNAELMRYVAPLYYAESVLDVTYGEGNWWTKYRPNPFAAHDLFKLDGVDFRALPDADNSWYTVCFDPPYIPAGGYGDHPTSEDYRDRYGLKPMSRLDLKDLVHGGMGECTRVATDFVAAKCNDYMNGAQFHLGQEVMIEAAKAHGWIVHDFIIHHAGAGIGGHNIMEVQRARRSHSYLIIFSRIVRRNR